jgi:transposase
MPDDLTSDLAPEKRIPCSVRNLKQGEETITVKTKRAQYTLELKLEAFRLMKNGQSLTAVSATLGVVQQTLHNWLKATREGKLVGAGAKPVSPERMELARLRAEVSRLKMELAPIILGARVPFANHARPRHH